MSKKESLKKRVDETLADFDEIKSPIQRAYTKRVYLRGIKEAVLETAGPSDASQHEQLEDSFAMGLYLLELLTMSMDFDKELNNLCSTEEASNG